VVPFSPGRDARIAAAALLLGALALVAATLLGSTPGVLDVIVHPPPLIRAGLVGGSAALAVILLGGALSRMAGGTSDVRTLIRGVRLVFLAIAAIAAAAGWALGHPLPLLVAAIVAGIDVIETSFLLLVVDRS
jgi:hypothetical protein